MSTTKVRDDQLPRGAGSAGEVLPIPAASVILLRDAPLEVLMIRRHARSSFVPDAWVFPGGVSEPADREIADSSRVAQASSRRSDRFEQASSASELPAMRVTALRELFEESGIWLGPSLSDPESKRRRLLDGHLSFRDLLDESPVDLEQLVWTSRWITPVGVPKRFDTWFFLAAVAREVVATAQESEAVEVLWVAPEEAVAKNQRGELQMVFPTLKNLEAICGFATAAELLAARRTAAIPTTRPLLVIEGGEKRIVLPE